jgi:hypothetical protein
VGAKEDIVEESVSNLLHASSHEGFLADLQYLRVVTELLDKDGFKVPYTLSKVFER